jgi:hypothetical protein
MFSEFQDISYDQPEGNSEHEDSPSMIYEPVDVDNG